MVRLRGSSRWSRRARRGPWPATEEQRRECRGRCGVNKFQPVSDRVERWLTIYRWAPAAARDTHSSGRRTCLEFCTCRGCVSENVLVGREYLRRRGRSP
jgi:hypothetical protein